MREQDGKTVDMRSDEDENDLDQEFDESEEDIDTDNVGEASVEIDLKALMAEMESVCVSTTPLKEVDRRKRLDDMLEQRRLERELRELESFDFE